MARDVRWILGLAIALLILGGPVAFSWYSQGHVRNLREVKEGVLYRSGQLSLAGLRDLIYERGIRTVVTLRDAAEPGNLPPDWEEEEYCRQQEINYVRISPRSWWSPEGSPPANEGVRKFLAVMDDPENYPVLLHCFAGVHRTGAFCAVYRMEYDRWDNVRAIEEVRAHGYRNLDDEWDILSFLESYVPRWKSPPAEAAPVRQAVQQASSVKSRKRKAARR
jgi:tyrosine-protein phosphatase SIW14